MKGCEAMKKLICAKEVEALEKQGQKVMYIDDNTLSVNMMRIREKLCALGAGNLIQTKRGMGYKI